MYLFMANAVSVVLNTSCERKQRDRQSGVERIELSLMIKGFPFWVHLTIYKKGLKRAQTEQKWSFKKFS